MGCNPDILENICPSGLRPSGLYFPIYPDYNPCTNIIHRRKIVHKTDILTNISVLCYNISEYQGQRTLVFYLYAMYNEIYIVLLNGFCPSWTDSICCVKWKFPTKLSHICYILYFWYFFSEFTDSGYLSNLHSFLAHIP